MEGILLKCTEMAVMLKEKVYDRLGLITFAEPCKLYPEFVNQVHQWRAQTYIMEIQKIK